MLEPKSIYIRRKIPYFDYLEALSSFAALRKYIKCFIGQSVSVVLVLYKHTGRKVISHRCLADWDHFSCNLICMSCNTATLWPQSHSKPKKLSHRFTQNKVAMRSFCCLISTSLKDWSLPGCRTMVVCHVCRSVFAFPSVDTACSFVLRISKSNHSQMW